MGELGAKGDGLQTHSMGEELGANGNVLPMLPNDVIIEILVRMPVRPVLRFKCVSKSWCNRIKEPSFINKYAIQSKKNQKKVVMMRCYSQEIDDLLSFHDLDSIDSNALPLPNLSIPVWGSHTTFTEIRLVRQCHFLGPCKGLVCIIDKDDFGGFHQRILLCNPSLQEFKLLPHCHCNMPPNWTRYICGRGFGHSLTNDFKVVILNRILRPTTCSDFYEMDESEKENENDNYSNNDGKDDIGDSYFDEMEESKEDLEDDNSHDSDGDSYFDEMEESKEDLEDDNSHDSDGDSDFDEMEESEDDEDDNGDHNSEQLRQIYAVVNLYNASTNSWRQIDVKDTVSPYGPDNGLGLFFNGACHWRAVSVFGDDTSPVVVLSLDMTTEAFKELEYPDTLKNVKPKWSKLAVVDEYLGLVGARHYEREYDSYCIDVWVMTEYGVKSSWVKQYVIMSEEVSLLPPIWKRDGYTSTLGRLQREMACIELVNKESKKFSIYWYGWYNQILLLEESLLSLNEVIKDI